MPELSGEITSLVGDMGPEALKKMRIASYRSSFEKAVRAVWRHDPFAADYVLAHVNGFYIHKDDTPRKSAFRSRDHILCTIYADDGTIRSDIDARQELLRLALARENIHYDELRILPSKFDMRTRRPYPEAVRRIERVMRGELPEGGVRPEDARPEPPSAATVEDAVSRVEDPRLAGRLREAMTAAATNGAVRRDGSPVAPAVTPTREAHELQTLKRAFCQVFGDEAADLLAAVRGAALEPVRWESDRQRREGRERWWCHLYADDPRLVRAVTERGEELRAHARDLGLRIQAIQFHEPFEAIRNAHAFPRTGYPVPLGNLTPKGEES